MTEFRTNIASIDPIWDQITEEARQAVADEPLAALIQQQYIRVGTKLLISGAELIGCDDGCDPLDPSFDPWSEDSPTLSIHINGTRLARWHSKLGFLAPNHSISRNDGMLLTKRLSDVVAGGGRIQMVDVAVIRRHDILYLNKAAAVGDENKTHLITSVLTEKQEVNRKRSVERRRTQLAERLVEELQLEIESVSVATFDHFSF